MALLAFDFDLQPLSLVFGSEVLEGTAGDAYVVPFDGFIGGEVRRITAVLQRTVVYEMPELKDKFNVPLFGGDGRSVSGRPPPAAKVGEER